MTQVVLILMMFTSGSNGGNALAMNDFQSMEKCEAAGKAAGADKAASPVAKSSQWGLVYLCVPK